MWYEASLHSITRPWSQETDLRKQYFAHQRGTCISFYALFVAGSNYFAPFICGFINDGMGYKWVFYWPAIFLGVGFVFLFFFMEETNYDRKTVGIVEANVVSATGSQGASELEVNPKSADSHQILDSEKTSMTFDTSKNQEAIREPVSPSRKTFRQKLALWDTGRPNLFFSRAKQQLLFLGWPVVFWAGFVLHQDNYVFFKPSWQWLKLEQIPMGLSCYLVQRNERDGIYYPRRHAVQFQVRNLR